MLLLVLYVMSDYLAPFTNINDWLSDPTMQLGSVRRHGFTPESQLGRLDRKHSRGSQPYKRRHTCGPGCHHDVAEADRPYYLEVSSFGTMSLSEALLPPKTKTKLTELFDEWCVPVPKRPDSNRKNKAMIERGVEQRFLQIVCLQRIMSGRDYCTNQL